MTEGAKAPFFSPLFGISHLQMITFPNCKINLGLYVTEKRPDGYHNIETCFYPAPWYDVLEVIEGTETSFESFGLPIPGDSANNLVLKAYHLLKADFDLPPLKIYLQKNIPMGAGLGGGSADGAFMLKLLNDKFALGIETTTLEGYALQLGSDCPFFIRNKAILASGRGNIFAPTEINLSGLYIVIAHPGIHVPTSAAFAALSPKLMKSPLAEKLLNPITAWHEHLQNDFEASVFYKFPAIADIKTRMYAEGAVYAAMSGSGSAVFGLFRDEVSIDWPADYRTKADWLK